MDGRNIAIFSLLLIASLMCHIALRELIDHQETELTFAYTQEIDGKTTVACGSDSMGLDFDCGDVLYYRNLKSNEELIEGKIYLYKHPFEENKTISHRLVKDCSDGCYGMIFKGDNNLISDPIVKREDVQKEILGVEYK
jgi:hypothetical protein